MGLGVGGILVAVTLAADGPFEPIVLAFAILGVVAIAAFARIERRSDHPLIPPHYWTMPGFVVPTVTLALLFAAYMGSFVLAPLMLQSVAFGATAAVTSRVIIARPLMFSLTGPVTGRLVERVGERILAVGGGLSIAVSMVLLSSGASGGSLVMVAFALGLAGLGMGAAAPILTATVANSVSDEDLGVAGAAQQMLQQVGLVVGVQVLQAVQASIEGDGRTGPAQVAAVVDSYQVAFLIAAGVAVLGVRRVDDAAEARSVGRGHGRESLIHLDRCAVGGSGLQCHEAGHVAIDEDLAGEEGLHDRLWIACDEGGLRCCVVDGDRQLGIVEVALLDDEIAVGAVDVAVQRAVWPMADVGHDDVHPHRDRRDGDLIVELGTKSASIVDPAIGEKGFGLCHADSGWTRECLHATSGEPFVACRGPARQRLIGRCSRVG